jgi:glycosyltransferase involved in cell wall biosynthesis
MTYTARRMRITFIVTADNFAGGNRVVALYAQELQQRGHEVTMVGPTLTGPTARQRMRRALNGLSHGSFGMVRQALEPVREVHGFLAQGKVPYRKVTRPGPILDADVPDGDVVVATWWKTAQWVSNLSIRKGVKAYFMQDYGAPGQPLEKLIETWRLGLDMITIAHWLEELVLSHVPDARIATVENAVDSELFRQPPRGMPTTPTVGFLYRELESKGFDTVVDAYRLARETVGNLHLLAFGSLPRERYKYLPNEAEYVFRPADSDLPSLYGRCTAWIFPSRREGFGLPILEAMACGTPVIATRAGAAPEAIGRAGGWLVEPGDARAMAAAMVEASTLEDASWQELSRRARSSVESYTWPDAGALFEQRLAALCR